MIIERIFAIFLGVILLIPLLIISIIKKRPAGRKILLILFTLYITAVISITVFPIIIEPEIMVFTDETINLIPFSTISELLRDNGDAETVILQLIGNIVMMIPFGVSLPFVVVHKHKAFYILDALLFPVMIECIQLLISFSCKSYYRTIDIDDVILNFVGILIGYLIFRFLPKFVKEFFYGKRQKEPTHDTAEL